MDVTGARTMNLPLTGKDDVMHEFEDGEILCQEELAPKYKVKSEETATPEGDGTGSANDFYPHDPHLEISTGTETFKISIPKGCYIRFGPGTEFVHSDGTVGCKMISGAKYPHDGDKVLVYADASAFKKDSDDTKAEKCARCMGEGKTMEYNGEQPCRRCNGTGKKVKEGGENG